jgi:hypothetical protein
MTAGAAVGLRRTMDGRGHEDLVGGGYQRRQVSTMLLGTFGVWIGADGCLDLLVGRRVVVLPDRHNAAIRGFPSPHQPGTVTELYRQQVRAEEVMKDRQVLPHGLIDAHPVEHGILL